MLSLTTGIPALESVAALQLLAAARADPKHEFHARSGEEQRKVYLMAQPAPPPAVSAQPSASTPAATRTESPLSADPNAWLPTADDLRRKSAWDLQRVGEAELARRLATAGPEPPAEGTPDQSVPPTLDVSELPPRADGRQWSAPVVQAFTEDARALGAEDSEVRSYLALDAGPGGFTPAHGEAFLAGLGELRKDAERAEVLAFDRLRLGVRSYLQGTGRRHDPRVKTALIRAGASLLADRETIDAILADKNHPSQNPTHPNHQDAQAELRELYVHLRGKRS